MGGAGSLPPSTAGHGGRHRRLQYWGEELSQGEPRSQAPQKRCVLNTGLSLPPLSGDRTAVGMHLALKDGSPAAFRSSSLALTSPRYSQRHGKRPQAQIGAPLCQGPAATPTSALSQPQGQARWLCRTLAGFPHAPTAARAPVLCNPQGQAGLPPASLPNFGSAASTPEAFGSPRLPPPRATQPREPGAPSRLPSVLSPETRGWGLGPKGLLTW